MMREPQSLKDRIASAIQMAFGLTLLLPAVSTDFDFSQDSYVQVNILANITAKFWMPAVMALGVKAGVAFFGSYLLMRRTLVLGTERSTE